MGATGYGSDDESGNFNNEEIERHVDGETNQNTRSFTVDDDVYDDFDGETNHDTRSIETSNKSGNNNNNTGGESSS